MSHLPRAWSMFCICAFAFVKSIIFLCCPIMCLYVLSFVLWCTLRFPHKNGSSLLLVVCRWTHVLLTLFVFACVQWCPTHIALFFFFLCTQCIQFSSVTHQTNITSVKRNNVWWVTIHIFQMTTPFKRKYTK